MTAGQLELASPESYLSELINQRLCLSAAPADEGRPSAGGCSVPQTRSQYNAFPTTAPEARTHSNLGVARRVWLADAQQMHFCAAIYRADNLRHSVR